MEEESSQHTKQPKKAEKNIGIVCPTHQTHQSQPQNNVRDLL
jgi:hypothetical protein